MIRKREIIIGRISLKAAHGQIPRSPDQNMIDRFLKGMVVVFGFKSVAEAVMQTDAFIGGIGCDVAGVRIPFCKSLLCEKVIVS